MTKRKKGGWEYHCISPRLAEELTAGTKEDKKWIYNARDYRMWVEVKRPRGKAHRPLRACGICHEGGRK